MFLCFLHWVYLELLYSISSPFLLLHTLHHSSPYAVSYYLISHPCIPAFYWFQLLFSPTLIRDLIEGNHSNEKAPYNDAAVMCELVHLFVCAYVCVWVRKIARGRRSSPLLPSSNPTTSSPLSLSAQPLKCHAALSTCLACYPPIEPLCDAEKGPQREGDTERERERWKRGRPAPVVDWYHCHGPLGAHP